MNVEKEGEATGKHFKREDYLKPGKSAKELVGELPQDGFVARTLFVLTSDEFGRSYNALPPAEQRIVTMALDRCRKSLLSRREHDCGQRPEEVFCNYVVGGQLDLRKVEALDLSARARTVIVYYRGNIERHGADAVAHICPPLGTLPKLERANGATIEGLERILESGVRVPYLTRKERGQLTMALATWRQALAQAKQGSLE